MKKTIFLCMITAILVIGCGANKTIPEKQTSNSATEDKQPSATLPNSTISEKQNESNTSSTDLFEIEDTSKSSETAENESIEESSNAEEPTIINTNVEMEDYIKDGVFDLDSYTARLGYTKLEPEPNFLPGNACYLVENHGQNFYCFCNAYSIFFCFYRDGLCYTCSFPCREVDPPMAVAYDQFTATFTEGYIQNQAYLIQYFATNNPSNEELRNLKQPGEDLPYFIGVCHDEPKYSENGWIDPTQFHNTDQELSYTKR